jgi:uncharacterized protein
MCRTRRGLQQESTLLLRSQNENLWKSAKFCVFDVPEVNSPFEERLQQLNKQKEINSSFLKIVDFVQCKGKDHKLSCSKNRLGAS